MGIEVAAQLPAGTVTFLLPDVEGSTQLLNAHPQAYRAAVRRHHELLLDAARLFGASEAVFEQLRVVMQRVDRADYDRNVAATRSALGAQAFQDALAEGKALPLPPALFRARQVAAAAAAAGTAAAPLTRRSPNDERFRAASYDH